MKGFVSFIAACAIYIFGGLVVWNIVVSMIDVPSSTLTELANYKLYCYSGIAAAVSFVGLLIADADDNSFNILLGALGVSLAIGIIMNVWEISGTAAIVMTIVYNVINVGVLTLSLYAATLK